MTRSGLMFICINIFYLADALEKKLIPRNSIHSIYAQWGNVSMVVKLCVDLNMISAFLRYVYLKIARDMIFPKFIQLL